MLSKKHGWRYLTTIRSLNFETLPLYNTAKRTKVVLQNALTVAVVDIA